MKSLYSKVKSISNTVYEGIKGVVNTVGSMFGGGPVQTSNSLIATASNKNNVITVPKNYIPGPQQSVGNTQSSKPPFAIIQMGGSKKVPAGSQPATAQTATQTYNTSSYGTDPSYSIRGATSLSSGSVVQSTIDSNTMSAGPINMPGMPVDQDYGATAIGGNVSLGADPTTGLIGMQTGEKKEDVKEESALDKYLGKIKAPESMEDLYLKAEEDSKVREKRQKVLETQNQINGITAQMQTELLKQRESLAQSGGTLRAFGGIEDRITREATIKLLPLQAQLAYDQGNLQIAESRLDTLFSIYSKDAQASVDYWNKQAEAIYEYTTKQEQRKLDEISKSKEFERQQLENQMKFHRDLMSDALKNNNVRLYNELSRIQSPVNINSPTYAREKQRYADEVNRAVSLYPPSPSSTTFTNTQLNTGAAKAGLEREIFNSLDEEVKNYYVALSPSDAANLKETIVKVKNGEIKKDEVIEYINSKGESPEVTEYLTGLIESVAPEEKEGFWARAWNGVASLFGE